MQDHPTGSRSPTHDLLSKVSRYEALFELTAVINGAADIESVGGILARRLKYVADVTAWRYICFDGDPEGPAGAHAPAIVIDGHQNRATVTRTTRDQLSGLELDLWRDRKTHILCDDSMRKALEQLPGHFQKDNLKEISVNPLVEEGRTRALHVFGRRRQPFTELDVKCLSMVCGFFHRKVHMLWEEQKLRDLQQAYLQQEVMLRQSEKLATLGRLSAGMAHELNNPTAVARQAAESLGIWIARLEHARFALGAAGLSSAQQERIERLEGEAEERAKDPRSLDPLDRSDLEQEIEERLERIGIEEPWEHAPTLVNMGLGADELDRLMNDFDSSITPSVIDYFSSRFMVQTLLKEIGQGAGRIAEIVKALKGYSYMDQGPIQSVDVREGLNDTLVMLNSRLRDGIRVHLDYADDLPRIDGYGGELNQVWTNLLDNAINAMAGGGALELRAYRRDDWVVVEVADTGPGIPPEAREKVFDPFFTTKAPGEGTGLGLSISHSIVVEKHRGRISVDSKPGATRFTVMLPVTNSLPGAAGGDGSPAQPSQLDREEA